MRAGDGSYFTGSCSVVLGQGARPRITAGNTQLAIGVGGTSWIEGNSTLILV